ncbi:hypothetical protein BH23CHL2_BH23CHL2_23190 [soil metagenome]
MPTGSLIGALNPLKSKPSIPEQLYLPTYQNQLRLVGRNLDTNEYRTVSILDVEGGILARAFNSRRHDSELLEFPDNAFREMVQEAITGRGRRNRVAKHSAVVPTGYEDLFRAIGWELDRRLAKAITIHECSDSIFVAGLAAVEQGSGNFSPFHLSFDVNAVQSILNAAFARRS